MNSTSCSARLVRIAGEIARLLEHRTRGRPDRRAELVADDVGERRLAEAGRTVQQHVIERFGALAGGRDRHLQVLAHAILADVVVEHARPKARLVLRVVVDSRGGDDAIVSHRVSRVQSKSRQSVTIAPARAAPASACVRNRHPAVALMAESTAFSASGR